MRLGLRYWDSVLKKDMQTTVFRNKSVY